MIVKKTSYKLYFKLIYFSLVIFLSISNLAISAVLTEEEIKYIESQSEDLNKDDTEDAQPVEHKDDVEEEVPF